MPKSEKVLVLGASPNPDRYSHIASNMLAKYGHQVVAVGRRRGQIGDIDILPEMSTAEDIDTLTLYLNPKVQESYIDDIIELKPKRVIFNPGTENQESVYRLQEAGIDTIDACTLVMLRTGQF